MGEDTILQIGAAGFTWDDLRWFGIVAVAGAGFLLAPWTRWHFRDWRLRRAVQRGAREHADTLAQGHEEDDRPSSLLRIAGQFTLLLMGGAALIVFQINFVDELEHRLGERGGFAAGVLSFAVLTGSTWAVHQIRRNAMSPEELAVQGEEELFSDWIRDFLREPAAGFRAGIALAVVIAVTIGYLLIYGSPG